MHAKRFRETIRRLQAIYKIRQRKSRPFETLIGGILSHRTKDETTFPALERLMEKADTPEGILALAEKEIAKIIYPVGFYPTKAKRLKQVCDELIERFDGKVPRTREELMGLTGVGGKTADVVLLFAFGKPVIPVDTHVHTISKRFHIAGEKDTPERTREKLHRLAKEKDRFLVNQLLVRFGREVCTAPLPKCYKCPIVRLCPYEKKNLKHPKQY